MLFKSNRQNNKTEYILKIKPNRRHWIIYTTNNEPGDDMSHLFGSYLVLLVLTNCVDAAINNCPP